LNQEDGVLSNLVAENLGIEPTNAQQLIKKYVESIKGALSTKGEFLIEGIGMLRLDYNGSIYLDTNTKNSDTPESGKTVQSATPTSTQVEIPQEDKPQTVEPTTQGKDPQETEQYGGIFSISATQPEVESPKMTRKVPTPINRETVYSVDAESDKPKKKVDMFLVFAIIAAIVAILSIVYGYLADNQEITLPKNNVEQIEQPADNNKK
jgi:nucleoid DNA-binding protein